MVRMIAAVILVSGVARADVTVYLDRHGNDVIPAFSGAAVPHGRRRR